MQHIFCHEELSTYRSVHWKTRKAHRTRTQLVESFRKDGYAVIRLSNDAKCEMEYSYRTMESYFEGNSHDVKLGHHVRVSEPSGGVSLLGYNQPTPAKELFRFRLDHPCRPAVPELEKALSPVYITLKDIVGNCVDAALQSATRQLSLVDVESAWSLLQRKDSCAEASPSPLDSFYYRNQADHAEIPNCDVHIDRGLAAAVVCSPVPGLSLQNPVSKHWMLVEPHLRPLQDVVVFPCYELQLVMSIIDDNPLLLTATTHRVDKDLRPRLAFNYELRSPSFVPILDVVHVLSPLKQ